jgi:hypothetical protein
VFTNLHIFALKIFYRGAGKVCAVVDLNQTLPVHHPEQNYTCEGTDSYLDDPYEGELFTWWLQFFGGLPESDIEALWEYKRAKLVSVDYHMGNVGPITVQKGETYISWVIAQTGLILTLNRILVLQP